MTLGMLLNFSEPSVPLCNMWIILSTLPWFGEVSVASGFVKAVGLHSVSGKKKLSMKLKEGDIQIWPRREQLLLARMARMLAVQGAALEFNGKWRILPP